MSINPKISVIIPIYNADKFLNQCLNSITNQTLENIEIICIDDGSTDNSLKIIEDYSKRDNRIKVISTENFGQGHARNLGLKQATGEYISFIDADDWIEKDTFEILYDKSKSYDLDVLFFQMVNYIDSSGELIKSDLYDYKILLDKFGSDFICSNNDILEEFLFKIAVCPVSKIYKKEFLNNNNIIFPEGIIFEDNVFFYNMILKAKKISLINKHLYYRRRHSDSVTQNISKKSFDIVLATNEMLNLFKNELWYDSYKTFLINHVFSMLMEWLLKVDLELKEEFYIKIKDEFLGFSNFYDDFKKYLENKYVPVFNSFLKNDHYLDFLTEYKSFNINYCIVNDKDSVKYDISIIIPVYTNEKLIHRTLLSIINQSFNFENIEVILVDDNSTDSTPKILDDYACNYRNIKVIHLKENTGAAGIPRNIGIKESNGKYLMFLDHDDFFDLKAIERLFVEISNSDVDVVFGTYNIIHNGNLTEITYSDEKNGYFDNICENERFVGFPPPSIWTKIFKRDFIVNNSILFPPILGEDAIFMNKVFFNARGIVYLDDLLVCFHDLSETSTTNNISLNYLTEGLISEKYLYDFFKENNKEYYFKYRCEGNLDFFLSQFLKSNLNREDIEKISLIFQWFVKKADYFNLKPKNINNISLFNFFLDGDVNSIYKFKSKFGNSKKKYLFKLLFGEKFFIFSKKYYRKFKKIKNKIF